MSPLVLNKKALVTDILCKLRLCVLKTDVIIVFVKCCFLCIFEIGRFGVDLVSIWCRFGVDLE